eukprot:8356090-Ditylum_brightwellii.AAC.1
MMQLAERNVISSAIKYIQKMPPCAACLVAKTQRRVWRTQRKKLRSIRKKHHTTMGDGTSTDHIVSHQPEFQKSYKKAQQSFSYCGVGAHHQNGIAEAMNKCLTHGARTSLLHARHKWSSIITSALWPFCYKAAEEQHNKLDVDAEGWSPLERFLGYKDEIAAEDFHTWGYPVYVLDSSLKSGTGIGPPKWDPYSRAGVYLGHSPHHAGN